MRSLLALLLLLMGMGSVMAQRPPEEEQLYIRYYDGSIFIGYVVDRDKYSYRLRIVTQDTITIQPALIKRIRSSKDLMIFPGGKYHFKRGIYGATSFGGGFSGEDGTGQWDVTVISRIKEDVHVGGGIGFEGGSISIAGFWHTQHFTSVYAYGRYYPFGRKKRRTFIDSKLGWGFSRNEWDGEHSGGVLAQPGIGLEFPSRHNFRWFLSLSQYIQNTAGESTEWGPFSQPVTTDYNVWYSRTMFKIGFQFK